MHTAKHEPLAVAFKIFCNVGAGVLFDFLYWDIGGKYDYQNVINMSGLCFVVMTNQLLTPVNNTILTFQLEREVFLREQAKRLYSPLAYYIAKNSLETSL